MYVLHLNAVLVGQSFFKNKSLIFHRFSLSTSVYDVTPVDNKGSLYHAFMTVMMMMMMITVTQGSQESGKNAQFTESVLILAKRLLDCILISFIFCIALHSLFISPNTT